MSKFKGEFGTIKLLSDTMARAQISDKKLAEEWAETVVFPVTELSKWMKRLRIYASEDSLIRSSNWFED